MSDASRTAEQELGRRVRALREGKGLSLEAMAKASRGLHWSYVGHLERSGKNITLANLLRIADALDVDLEELVHGLTLDGEV